MGKIRNLAVLTMAAAGAVGFLIVETAGGRYF